MGWKCTVNSLRVTAWRTLRSRIEFVGREVVHAGPEDKRLAAAE